MTPVCGLARPFVVAAAAEGGLLPRVLARHHRRCLRCQAVTVRTRATVRELRSMSFDLPISEPAGGAHPSRLVAPVAAGAALTVALILMGRRLLDPA